MTPVRPPPVIVCVDCGGRAHYLGHPDDDLEPGDVAAYRCEDCRDRWDLVVDIDDAERGEPS
jgi:hypothetical protein